MTQPFDDLDWDSPQIERGVGALLDLIGEGYTGKQIAAASFALRADGKRATKDAIRKWVAQ